MDTKRFCDRFSWEKMEKQRLCKPQVVGSTPTAGSIVRGRLRYELLNCEIFATLAEAKVMGKEYRRSNNEQRLHSSLGSQTPAEFARRCLSADSTTLGQPKGNAVSPN
ncbi:integrase core domain-containing protein [Prosthecobacter sp.]|uniref:integrase core domain-containing protein n=1 Tax=Prosthecobacter sp. TaxID=1965333 RepID=UPI0037852A1C